MMEGNDMNIQELEIKMWNAAKAEIQKRSWKWQINFDGGKRE